MYDFHPINFEKIFQINNNNLPGYIWNILMDNRYIWNLHYLIKVFVLQ
jgi:hypothetical protein